MGSLRCRLIGVLIVLAVLSALLPSGGSGIPAAFAQPPEPRLIRVIPGGLATDSVAAAASCGSADKPCPGIQRALDMAQAGDVIALAVGVYTGTGEAVISLVNRPAVTIRGGYNPADWSLMTDLAASDRTILDGQGIGAQRVIAIKNVSGVQTFENLVIQNGYADETEGLWDAMGGGMLCLEGATIVLRNVVFRNNVVQGKPDSDAVGGGGAAFLYGGTGPCSVTMYDVTFENNVVRAGNAVTNDRGGHGLGGGFFITYSDLVAVNLRLTGNRVWGGNGGTGGVLGQFGRADALGGGAAIQFSNSVITNVVATDNHTLAGQASAFGGSGDGGGLFYELGVGRIYSATIMSNSVTGGASPTGTGGIGGGGGLMMERQILTVERAVIVNNRATGGNGLNSGHAGGGGIYLTMPRTVTPAPNRFVGINLVLANNVAEAGTGNERWGGGGAIFSQNTELTLYHSTLSGHRILDTMSGCGIVIVHDPDIGTSRADISGNIIANHTCSGYARDAILAKNAGTVAVLRDNLFYNNANNVGIGRDPSDNAWPSVTQVGSVSGDPRFVSPQTYNYHVRGDSAAVNRLLGGLAGLDIDAQKRPYPAGGLADIGADEAYTALSTSSKTVTPRTIDTRRGGPDHSINYVITLRNSSGSPVSADLIDTLPSPPAPLTLTLKSGPQCSAGSCRFDAGTRRIIWSGSIPAYGQVTIGYAVTLNAPVTFGTALTLTNSAHVTYLDAQGQSNGNLLYNNLLINPVPSYLPLLLMR